MKISKGKVLILLIVFTLCFVLSTIFSSTVKSYAPKYGITTARLNFRENASTSSKIIKVLAKGTSVKMVAQLDNFYIVQLTTNEVGYVSKDYIKVTSTPPSPNTTYYSLANYTAKITDSVVNLRGGPSTNYRVVKKLTKGTTVTVIGRIDNFNLVLTSNNTVGMVKKDLLTKVSTTSNTTNNTNTNTTNTSNLSNVDKVLALINEERAKNNIPALKKGAKLSQIAVLKANEMVEENYFSHTSPTYGSPFNMMKNFGLSYITAGENIAGNSTLEGAVEAWMNSEKHRENILSTSYNYAGVGVTKSSTYGYVVVVMFAGV